MMSIVVPDREQHAAPNTREPKRQKRTGSNAGSDNDKKHGLTFTFEPIRVIGKGFFGIVQHGTWEVKSAKSNESGETGENVFEKISREVAIKSIPKTREYTSHGEEGFSISNKPLIMNEINVMVKLKPLPFINSLVGIIQEPNTVHLVLDYCPGGDLFGFIERHRTSAETKIYASTARLDHMRFFMREIVSAVASMHAQHVMHGDLKCENVLIDRNGHIQLCDFGLAMPDCQENRNFNNAGTELYAAPEQIQRKMFGKSTDVWTIGYILLFMFFEISPVPFQRGDTVNRNVALAEREVRVNVPHEHMEAPFYNELLDLLRQVLHVDRNSRPTMEGVQKHRLFQNVVWSDIEQKRELPPSQPLNDTNPVSDPASDATYFEDVFTAIPTKPILVKHCISLNLIPR